jgi:predicted deacylase
MNMNRAFLGKPAGNVTSQIAHFLTTVLLPLGDVVIDSHSGGRRMEFLPCVHMPRVSDLEQRRKMLAAMLAWSTDFGFRYAGIAGSGLRNVLMRVCALRDQAQTRQSLSKAPTILTHALNREDYLLAPESGVFEVCLELGQEVQKGYIVGHIHYPERPDRRPETIVAQTSGDLLTMRASCLTQQGHCVAVIAQQVSLNQVLRQ